MQTTSRDACLTCYGAGEMVTDRGPSACPDCFGEGEALSAGTKLEWRLRAIERGAAGAGREVEADVRFLVHELRRHRDVLVRILARCQDAEGQAGQAEQDGTDGSAFARDIKFEANEALAVYAPK